MRGTVTAAVVGQIRNAHPLESGGKRVLQLYAEPVDGAVRVPWTAFPSPGAAEEAKGPLDGLHHVQQADRGRIPREPDAAAPAPARLHEHGAGEGLDDLGDQGAGNGRPTGNLPNGSVRVCCYVHQNAECMIVCLRPVHG